MRPPPCDIAVGSIRWLMVVLALCGQGATQLVGSLTTCDNDGEEIFIPHISSDPCIRCVCKNTIVECSRKTCQPLEGCHVILHDKPAHACCDVCKGCTHMGRHYPSGTEWAADEDPCQRYRCDAAVITGFRVQCTLTCKNPITVARQCCPVCNGCKVGGLVIAENSTVTLSEDNCAICSCRKGQLLCEKRGCPVLNCLSSSQLLQPGACCPVCVDHRRVFDLATLSRCFFRRQVYAHGTAVYIGQDVCTKCTCINGTIVCKRRVCPQLDCALNNSLTSSIQQSPTCCGRCQKYKRHCPQGVHKHRHGDTWKPNSCTHCHCYDGIIRCHVEQCSFNGIKCPKNYQIKIREGTCCPECVEANGVCAVFGDPHYRTFDGRIFTFQGPCSYLLAASGHSMCGSLTGVASSTGFAIPPAFSVRVTNVVHGSSKMFAWTKSVSVAMADLGIRRNGKVKIDLYQKLRVHVNRTKVELPYVDRDGAGLTIEERLFGSPSANQGVVGHGDQGYDRLSNGLRVVVLTTTSGFQVMWDGGSYLELSVPSQYKNLVCGLCGNYNGIVGDDFTGPDGRFHYITEQFGISWQTPSKVIPVSDDGHRNRPATCGEVPEFRHRRNSSTFVTVDATSEVGLRRRGSSSGNGETKLTGCERSGKLLEAVEIYCKSILKGPAFDKCRSYINVEPYYRSCVMDSCNCPRVWQRCACQTFTAYGRACQRGGVLVVVNTRQRKDAAHTSTNVETAVDLFRWPCRSSVTTTAPRSGRDRGRQANGKRRQKGNEVLQHLTGRKKESEFEDSDQPGDDYE